MEVFKYRADILPNITLIGKHEGPHTTGKRLLKEHVFYMVADGEVGVIQNTQKYILKKGDCLFLESGVFHEGIKSEYCKLYYIHFTHPDFKSEDYSEKELAEKVRENHLLWRTCNDYGPFPEDEISICKKCYIEDKTSLSTLCGMIDQILIREKIRLENHNVLCSCSVSEFFVEHWRQYVQSLIKSANRDIQALTHIDAVIAYLNTNYQRRLSSSIVEKELSYNFDYLNQLFRRHLNISIFRMLENIRIEAAKKILQTQAISVKQVAERIGYADETYFSKVFKAHTGTTPAKYRKLVAQAAV